MKKHYLYILLLSCSSTIYGQDTLKNFNPQAQVPVATQYSNGIHTGYVSGHNSLFDEEWGEKYYIKGSNQVTGVIAYHAGSNGTYNGNVEYKIYNVAPDGLPGNELGKSAISGSTLNISGAPVYTAFNSAVNVKDSFFLSFNIGDYAHHSPGTKKIALQHGPDGSRATNDTNMYGRNAIRWHDHDATIWVDFFKENNTPIRTHFALFPVVTLKNTDVKSLAGQGAFKMGAVYPNPSTGNIRMNIENNKPEILACSVMDQQGRIIKTWEETMNSTQHTISTDIQSLPVGQYILLVGNGYTHLAQTFIKQ